MTRVDEFKKKYPGVHREIIVKTEALHRGIRDSAALDEVGRWLPDGGPHGTYQSYDHDLTLKDLATRKPTTVRPGYIKNLGPFHTRNGLGVRIERNSTSPYEIRKLGSGQFALYEGEEKVEDIYFPHIPWPFEGREEPVTSKGTLATGLVNLKAPNCFVVVPVRYCEYFATGEQCKFCNFNASQEDARSIGNRRAISPHLEETAQAYKILCSEIRFVEGQLVMGALRNSEQEAKVHFDFVEKMSSATSYELDITAIIQPISRKNMQRLRDVGVNCFALNMEVWDRRLFAEVCPGKAKYYGYERYKEAFLEAVDIFGDRTVSCNFVAGITMMPPNGHDSWQEARDSFIDGLRWLMKNGVHPHYNLFRWAPGSALSQDASNRDKLVPTEFFLDAVVAHHETMKEYGRYERFHKLSTSCPMDCLHHSFGGEIGMLEIGGNMGNWLADALPEKANWLARFNASLATR
ncbi:MAG: hypothetical protein Q7O66_16520 [Dehalococcoidia bacterium]|nr:hypothetical protein [Dehalococcoidia bacterium]